MSIFVSGVIKGNWVNPRFSDTHDEADLPFPFHAVDVEQLNPGNTVIRYNHRQLSSL